MGSRKEKVGLLLFMFVFISLILSNLLDVWIPASTLTNSIVVSVLSLTLLKLLYDKKKKVICRDVLLIVCFISLFGLVLLLPNVFFRYHASISYQLYTFFSDIKFILIYLCGRYLFIEINLLNTKKFMISFSWLFTLSCLFLYVINLGVPILKVVPGGKRYGINTYSYGFGHPAQFALVVIILSILYVLLNKLEGKRSPYLYICLNFILIITAGRTTSIGFYLCLFILIIFLQYVKNIHLGYLFLVIPVFLVFGWERINQQLFHETSEARGVLLSTALKISNDHFPLGVGLGLFGSEASRIHYSPYYYIYNINTTWGLLRSKPTFVADSYWAMIIGETGVLGTICLVILFFIFIRSVCGFLKNTCQSIKILVVLPFIYALVTSPIDTILVSRSVIIVIFVILYMSLYVNDYEEKYSLNE